MIDPQIKELLRKDIEERTLMRKALRRVKRRQTVMIVIGIMIFLMFLVNYTRMSRQIKKQDEVILTVAGALMQGAEIMDQNSKLIKLQDSVIKDLKNQNDILKK